MFKGLTRLVKARSLLWHCSPHFVSYTLLGRSAERQSTADRGCVTVHSNTQYKMSPSERRAAAQRSIKAESKV